MKFLRHLLILLFVFPVLSTAQTRAPVSPEQLRLRLEQSVGPLPSKQGYQVDGRFVLTPADEEISYQVRIVQAYRQIAGLTTIRRAADFTNENRSRDLRFFISDEDAWVASPEITVDVIPEQIPYMARFDFYTLYVELLDILTLGTRSPEFRIDQTDNEVYVHGLLKNGWNAVFTLNALESYPRKIRISTDGERIAAWMVPHVSPGSIWRPQPFPGTTTEFEVWISNPVSVGYDGFRPARRMDFIENSIVVGSFFLDENRIADWNGAEAEDIFARPSVFPWNEGIRFESAGGDYSVIFSDDSLNAARSRLAERPWAQWERYGRSIAYFSIISSGFSRLLPYSVPPRSLTWIIFSGYVILLLLLFRLCRPCRSGVPPRFRKFPLKTAIFGLFVGFIMFIAGLAVWAAHLPIERSRMALHAAIRFTVTGNEIFASGADGFLKNIARKAPTETFEELGRSCQNYAFAYELIRNYLTPQRRAQIETELFEYAKPLLGAASGWRTSGADAAAIVSGLGLTGLAIGFEPFISTAETVVEHLLSYQLSEGLHKAGPGIGNAGMDAAANLFYGLRLANRIDYYADSRFQEYVSTTLKLLSPAGTLPLFSGTNLDDSLGLSMFFLKTADKMPKEIGGQCVAAHNLYMEYGIFNSEGWTRRFAPLLLPFLAYYQNPHVLLQYETAVTPSELPGESFATGDGQFAALRSGSGPEAMYLAINMLRSGFKEPAGDALSFDLFARRSLMLHGSAFPPEDNALRRVVGNTPTFNDGAQIANMSRGVMPALLNQPVFDSARAVADRAYEYGQVKRDFIMARPEESIPGYFIIMDNIAGIGFDTNVRWRIHGRGETASGLDRRIRWKSTTFEPPRLMNIRAALEIVHPLGIQGTQSTSPETLRSSFPFFNQRSQCAQIQWIGDGTLCSIMIPHAENEQPPVVEAQGEYVCRIGASDLFSFGDLTRRIRLDTFEHVSEYSLVRNRGKEFPALVMAFGLELRFGEHSILSNKPVTVSLGGGLFGSLQNDQYDTRVIISSPDIRQGAQFFLDEYSVIAEKPGVLELVLAEAGTHSLRGR